VPEIKFVTFSPKYVTKKSDLLHEVYKGRTIRDSDGMGVKRKRSMDAQNPQPELFAALCFDASARDEVL